MRWRSFLACSYSSRRCVSVFDKIVYNVLNDVRKSFAMLYSLSCHAGVVPYASLTCCTSWFISGAMAAAVVNAS